MNDELKHLRRVGLAASAVFFGVALLGLFAGLTMTEPIRALAFVASFFFAIVGGSLLFGIRRFDKRHRSTS